MEDIHLDPIDFIRAVLRLKTTAFDEEIAAAISGCVADLERVGITYHPFDDGLVREAVIAYVKCHVGYEPEAERFQKQYEAARCDMKISLKYHGNGGGAND